MKKRYVMKLTNVDLVPLEKPEGSYGNVGVQVRLAMFGERALKGWALTKDTLGDGWKSLVHGNVNLGHIGADIWGHVAEVGVNDDSIYANLMLSRAKLKAEGVDPARLTKDFKVSLEWIYDGENTFITKGSEKFNIAQAIEKGIIEEKPGPEDTSEYIVADSQATMWPVGVTMYGLALVDLSKQIPAYPSATILHASATDIGQTYDQKFSIEYYMSKLDMALEEKFAYKDGEFTRYPWRRATYADEVVFQLGDKLLAVSYSISENKDIIFGEAKNVEERWILTSSSGKYKTVKGSTEEAVCVDCKEHISDYIEEIDSTKKKKCPNCGGIVTRMIDADDLLNESSIKLQSILAVPSKKKDAPKTPPKGYPTDKGQYADPANYGYPVDTSKRCKAAIGYFRNLAARGDYTAEEKKSVAKRIVSAARKFGIEVDPKSIVGQYAGLKASKSSEVKRGGESVEEITLKQEDLDKMLSSARDEGARSITEGLMVEDNEHRKAIISEYEEKVLPTKVEAAVKAATEKIVKDQEALAALEAIHPLTDDEKKLVREAMVAGTFNSELEVTKRELSKLKGELEKKTENAGSSLTRTGSGLNTVDGGETIPDPNQNEENEDLL